MECSDLSDPGVIRNPYSLYRALRERGRVIWSDTLFSGSWLVLGYDEALQFLSDAEHISSHRERYLVDALPEAERGRFDTLIGLHSQWFVHYDPPLHTRVKRIISRGFSRGVLDRLTEFVRGHVRETLSRFCDGQVIDVPEDLARDIPLSTIARLLGLPADDRQRFWAWTDRIAAYMGSEKPNLDAISAAEAALIEFRSYFDGVFRMRRAQPMREDDMLSLLQAEGHEDGVLSEDELFAQCVLIAFAGNETTRNLIANALFLALSQSGVSVRLRENPALIPNLIRETLRFESPVQFVNRIVKRGFGVGSVELRTGDYVAVMLGAANRDERVFEDPDRFDLLREGRPAVSFGPGIHSCVGQGLAKIEAQVAIEELFAAFPNSELAPDGARWRNNPGLRGLDYLHVRLGR